LPLIHGYVTLKIFDKAMEECLESIDEYVILLNSPHFCKKVYYYLNPIGEVK
jgi:hypothetical protein